MSTTQEVNSLDEVKLNAFIGQILSDLGGASSVAMVRMGDALGLYKTLHSEGPMTSAELARTAVVDERYLREWLSHQAASDYLSYEPESARFSLPPEQAMVFTKEDSPVYMMGGFDLMAALLDNQPKVQASFKSGTGVAWGDQAGCMFCAVARFFRPGYHNSLVSAWLPALHGVVKNSRLVRWSPTLAAGTAGPRSSWPRHSRIRSSSATIFIRTQSTTLGTTPRRTVSRPTRGSRLDWPRTTPPRTSTS